MADFYVVCRLSMIALTWAKRQIAKHLDTLCAASITTRALGPSRLRSVPGFPGKKQKKC